MRAADIHAHIGTDWPAILVQLGIPETALRNKHGPCPACGGKDRFRFDHGRKGRNRGDYICGQCGAGDGFKLLMSVHGWTFAEARRQVLTAAHLESPSGMPAVAVGSSTRERRAAISPDRLPTIGVTPDRLPQRAPAAQQPSAKVLAIRRGSCAVADCQDAVTYLESRALWPLPPGCTLKAHPSLEYWHEGTGARNPGLVAEVRDIGGDLVTLHVTYLCDGRKLNACDARKILSPVNGHEGCAARLLPVAQVSGAPECVLGVAEGVETALSAALLDGAPVWAALNTSLLAKFQPSPGVTLLRVYADRDAPGLEAAARLIERLQGVVKCELRVPSGGHKDFNYQLMSRNRGGGATRE
jgi:putative DNA primase/helicase